MSKRIIARAARLATAAVIAAACSGTVLASAAGAAVTGQATASQSVADTVLPDPTPWPIPVLSVTDPAALGIEVPDPTPWP